MDENLFKRRTKQLALRVIKTVESLPKNRTADVLGRQLLRSGTSIGANYRAACRGKSTADVIAKLRIVEEEADESAYWMELLVESGLVSEARLGVDAGNQRDHRDDGSIDKDSSETQRQSSDQSAI